MQFYTRKRTRPAVPIVSLIDILAILLIFFIVTTTFKKEKPLLHINLPTTKKLATVVETAERTTISATSEGKFFLSGNPVDPGALEAALTSFKKQNPEGKLELKADETVPLKDLIQIWDAITAAGYKVKNVPARIVVETAPGE